MESRRVTLLKLGYFTGRLNFQYTQPLSKQREYFILNELEREQVIELTKLRAIIDAGILGTVASRSKPAMDIPYKALEAYTDLALPYINKKDNINKATGVVEDKEYWLKFMAEKKKKLFPKAEEK